MRASTKLLKFQLQLLPPANPLVSFQRRFEADLKWLADEPLDAFHGYSFATLRQFGACYELASTYLQWLIGHKVDGLERIAAAFLEISSGAKALQFQLARAISRKKPLDFSPLAGMADHWDHATSELRRRFVEGSDRGSKVLVS